MCRADFFGSDLRFRNGSSLLRSPQMLSNHPIATVAWYRGYCFTSLLTLLDVSRRLFWVRSEVPQWVFLAAVTPDAVEPPHCDGRLVSWILFHLITDTVGCVAPTFLGPI